MSTLKLGTPSLAGTAGQHILLSTNSRMHIIKLKGQSVSFVLYFYLFLGVSVKHSILPTSISSCGAQLILLYLHAKQQKQNGCFSIWPLKWFALGIRYIRFSQCFIILRKVQHQLTNVGTCFLVLEPNLQSIQLHPRTVVTWPWCWQIVYPTYRRDMIAVVIHPYFWFFSGKHSSCFRLRFRWD